MVSTEEIFQELQTFGENQYCFECGFVYISIPLFFYFRSEIQFMGIC